jgi:hypothetical protein
MLERRALEILHRDERFSVLLADVVNGADIGMVEGRGSLRLTLETAQCQRIAGNIVGKELKRDETMQSGRRRS